MTDLARHLNDELIQDMISFSQERSAHAGTADPGASSPAFSFKSLEAGAATQVWAATAAGLESHNGAYLADCGLGVLGADPGVNGFLAYLLDDEMAAALWGLSEELVGEPFAIPGSS